MQITNIRGLPVLNQVMFTYELYVHTPDFDSCA